MWVVLHLVGVEGDMWVVLHLVGERGYVGWQ